MEKLIRSFPILKNAPLDPFELDEWTLTASDTERIAAQFCLGVYNHKTQWQAGKFDIFEAANKMDNQSLTVISEWLKNPWMK